jgi:hypothetical protein
MNDNMAICVIKYMLEKVEDRKIRPVFEYALKLANVHVQTITGIFKEESYRNWQYLLQFKKTITSRALLIGFSQVAKSKEVRAFMVRGTDIGFKHI